MHDDNSGADQGHVDENKSGNPLEENLKSGATWNRFLFMIISSILMSLANVVGTVVVVLGFLWVLFTGEINKQLREVGQSIASYVYAIIRYLTFNSNERPFPLGGKWPSSDAGDS
jgi:hypothetical protein